MSHVKQNKELDSEIGKASAVMQVMHHQVVSKHKFLKKAKLSVFKIVFAPHSQIWSMVISFV